MSQGSKEDVGVIAAILANFPGSFLAPALDEILVSMNIIRLASHT
jgi:hypothetical protein